MFFHKLSLIGIREPVFSFPHRKTQQATTRYISPFHQQLSKVQELVRKEPNPKAICSSRKSSSKLSENFPEPGTRGCNKIKELPKLF
jgi:hypothetical protein